MTWEHAAGPLVRYCARPWPAQDLADVAPGEALTEPPQSDGTTRQWLDGHLPDVGHLVRRALQILDDEGLVSLARRVRRKLRRQP